MLLIIIHYVRVGRGNRYCCKTNVKKNQFFNNRVISCNRYITVCRTKKSTFCQYSNHIRVQNLNLAQIVYTQSCLFSVKFGLRIKCLYFKLAITKRYKTRRGTEGLTCSVQWYSSESSMMAALNAKPFLMFFTVKNLVVSNKNGCKLAKLFEHFSAYATHFLQPLADRLARLSSIDSRFYKPKIFSVANF